VLLATWIFAPPQAGEKDERRFEKRNLCSRVPRLRVHVAVFWSHAKSRAVLGGTLGENAAWCSGHGSSVQADGCGLSPAAGPARHVVLCGHRSVFSSPPGRRNVSPPRIFSTNPPYVHIVYMYIREEEERQRKVYSKRTGEEKVFIDTKHHTWIECASALHVRPPQPRTLECVLHRT